MIVLDAPQNNRGGGKSEGKFHYVIENTYRKMSEIGLAIISMKKMHIEVDLHYVCEKKVG